MLTGPTSENGRSPIASVLRSSRLKSVPCCIGGHLAEVTFTNLTGANSVSFGTFDPGVYIVRNCAFGWQFGAYGWAACKAPAQAATPPGNGGHFFKTVYKDADDADAYAVNNEKPLNNGFNGYATEAAAIAAGCGKYSLFAHYGGEIGMAFADNPYNDNFAGASGNPRFRLYLYTTQKPCFEIVSINGTNPSSENFYTATIKLKEICGGYGRCTFTLQESGGIANPSAPVVVTVTPGLEFTIGYNWEGSPTNQVSVTATIGVTEELYNTTLADIVCDITPILTAELDHINGYNSGCGYTDYWASVKITNVGNQNSSTWLYFTVTEVSGCKLVKLSNPCVEETPYVKSSVGYILEGESFQFVVPLKKNSPSDTHAVVNIVAKDGPVNYPAMQVTIPYP